VLADECGARLRAFFASRRTRAGEAESSVDSVLGCE